MVRAVYLLPFIPASALAASLAGAVTYRWSRWRHLPCIWTSLGAATLFLLAYRGWERNVGPGPFRWGGLGLSSANLFFLALLVLLGPVCVLLSAEGERGGREGGIISALGLLALAAALAAVLGEEPFILAAGCALGTLCAAGAALPAAGPKRRRLRMWLAILALLVSDACLALSVLFLYRAGVPGGPFLFSFPVGEGGLPAMLLLLSAALLRLGIFPLLDRGAIPSGEGRGLRIPYLVAMNLILGAYLLFLASRVLFSPGGAWEWAMLGSGACGLACAAVGTWRGSHPGRERGWSAVCLGSGVILCFSAAGREGATAARLVLLAGMPALLLLEMKGARGWRRSLGMIGGAALAGTPPLAGFASLWATSDSLARACLGGEGILFFLGWGIMAVAFLVVGTTSLFDGGRDGEVMPAWAAAACGLLLCTVLFLAGAYPGRVVDILMREYGLPLDIPFPGWSSLAWASLVVAAGLSFFRRVRAGTVGAGSGSKGRPPGFPGATGNGVSLRALAGGAEE